MLLNNRIWPEAMKHSLKLLILLVIFFFITLSCSCRHWFPLKRSSPSKWYHVCGSRMGRHGKKLNVVTWCDGHTACQVLLQGSRRLRLLLLMALHSPMASPHHVRCSALHPITAQTFYVYHICGPRMRHHGKELNVVTSWWWLPSLSGILTGQ